MFPIGDSPNPPGTPWVTYSLIATNVLVYLLISLPLSTQGVDANHPLLGEYLEVVLRSLPSGVSPQQVLGQISAYDLITFEFGFRPSSPSLIALFTSMFLHAGLMHLAGNMLFLWIYGDNVEHHLGRIPYLLWYLVTGLCATALHSLLDLGSVLPTIGASGAISGVLGFYFVFFPRNTVKVFIFFFPFLIDVIRVPARIVLGIYLIINNLFPFFATAGSSGGGVAYAAHIGGFIAGGIAAWVMSRREMTGRPKEYRKPAAAMKEVRSPADAITGAIGIGEYEKAAQLYFSLPAEKTRRLIPAEDSLAMGNWLSQNGHAEAALAVFRRVIRDFPVGPNTAAAHVGAGIVQLYQMGEPTAAYQHFLDALENHPLPQTERQAREGLEAIENIGRRRGPR